jgi:hypothetical protein
MPQFFEFRRRHNRFAFWTVRDQLCDEIRVLWVFNACLRAPSPYPSLGRRLPAVDRSRSLLSSRTRLRSLVPALTGYSLHASRRWL